MARGSAIRPVGKRSSSFTGKSKVISTSKGGFHPIKEGRNHMFGKQTVKAAKPR